METQWWGHSKVHGWVVLDRTLVNNEPGHKDNLMFFRCRDSMTYMEKRKNWVPPSYQFAPNYIKTLTPELATEASEALAAVQGKWPEYQAQMQKEIFEAEQRVIAERDAAELAQKEAAKLAAKEKLLAQKALKAQATPTA